MYKYTEIDFDGKKYSLESGKYAKFANGAVMVRCGDTMVLVTATASSETKENIDFLPLSVEYKEKLASSGKIPGGFLKRETRPSDHEVLCARLIDRPIRPMITKAWNHETQIIATVYSYDPECMPDTLAAVGASAALMISDIPFNGPISEVRVGRVDGKFIVNPSEVQTAAADLEMTVAGTDTAITMVEGEAHELTEDEFLEALEFAHTKIKELNGLQKLHLEGTEITKQEVIEKIIPAEIIEIVKENIEKELFEFVHTQSTKKERTLYRSAIKDKAVESVLAKYVDDAEADVAKLTSDAKKALDELERNMMRNMILDEKVRLDGRKTDEIRGIVCETNVLPRTHGCALFTRGETQSLSTVTLGTTRDEQMIDGLSLTRTENFMLHYNFPPFCVGETGRMGVSRREVGHGHLAWRALKAYMPEKDGFPYTIRIISDILESNGSSSMATVCAGSLALFEAGVPMKKQVAGIAMGLIAEGDKYAVLSDILGDEDHLGDMDFKVAGSTDGITAFQMDIKVEGLPIEIMKSALAQAREGRLHILGIMNKTIDTPKEDVSPYAPRFFTIKIPVDCIGAVIGSGGETIRGICKDAEVEINIEDDGTVTIAAVTKENADKARAIIELIIKKPEVGEIYEAKVIDVREGLGAICEIMPGTKGLLHVSQIAWERVENVGDVLHVGDKFDIKLIEVQRDGKLRLSRKILLPKPEGMSDEHFEEMKKRAVEPAPSRDGGRDSRGGGRDSRGGDRDRGGDRGGDRRDSRPPRH